MVPAAGENHDKTPAAGRRWPAREIPAQRRATPGGVALGGRRAVWSGTRVD